MVKHLKSMIYIVLLLSVAGVALSEVTTEEATVLEAECTVQVEVRKVRGSSAEVQYMDGHYYLCEVLMDIKGETYLELRHHDQRINPGDKINVTRDFTLYNHDTSESWSE